MKQRVLDLVVSYQTRISAMEQLISAAHYTTASVDESLGTISKERENLKTSLQEMLAKNRSLRKKDSGSVLEKAIPDMSGKIKEMEAERQKVRDRVREYLDAQTESAAFLRQQLDGLATPVDGDQSGLEEALGKIKSSYRDKGQQIFAMLGTFQRRLDAFRTEQRLMNYHLQTLVDKGSSLRVEDLRQLEAAKPCLESRGQRSLRRAEMGESPKRLGQHPRRSSRYICD